MLDFGRSMHVINRGNLSAHTHRVPWGQGTLWVWAIQPTTMLQPEIRKFGCIIWLLLGFAAANRFHQWAFPAAQPNLRIS